MNLLDLSCRAAIRLYPTSMREEHGEEMRQTFLESCAHAWRGGLIASVHTVLAELGDLLKAAWLARRGFPYVPGGREPNRPRREGGWMTALASDLRQAIRALRARPGTTAMAISLLALAIASCVAVFTVADAVILNPFPYRDADRLAAVGIVRRPGGPPSPYSRAPLITAWRNGGIFEQVEAHATDGINVDTGGVPFTEAGAWITPGLIDMLGVAPIRGRTFNDADTREAIPPALISERLWRVHLGTAADIIGRTVSLNGRQARIIGVMPEHFRFPHGRQRVWRPFDLARPPADVRLMTPLARLKRNMPRDESARLATEVARGVDPRQLQPPAQVGFGAPGGGRAFDLYTVNTVRLLFAGVLLVLLVACVNVANLLLARALGRRRERAVRTALGASRRRLVQQALLESLLIAGSAAIAGLAIAAAVVASFDRLLPEFMTSRGVNQIDLDGRAAATVIVLALAAALASGVLPAWLGTRAAASSVLKDADRGASEGRAGRRLASGLIVSEIALAFALLVGAALMIRSFVALASAERGIDTRGVVQIKASLPEYQESDPARRATLAAELEARLRAMPSVSEVASTLGVPPDAGNIHFQSVETDAGRKMESVEFVGFTVKPEIFGLLRMQLAAGRFLRADDAPGAVVLSETFAARLWPGESAVARTFRMMGDTRVRHVVGVTREIRTPLLDPRVDFPEYFEAYTGYRPSFIARLREGAVFEPDQFKEVIRGVHPKYIAQSVRRVDDMYASHLERPKTAVAVASAFAAFGMIVSAAGLFSVLSLSVARRRHEFGIRLAIGAHPGQLSRLVAKQAALTIGAGLLLGAGAGYAVARALQSVLADIKMTDVPSWIAVAAVVTIAAVAAAWLPIRDARRTDPLLLLREE